MWLYRMRQGAVLGLAVLAADAQAAGWSDFEAAFPMFPCPDGWMACLVEDGAVDPELDADTRGLPVLGDARIGWFDLAATRTFSPFVDLSAYPAEPASPKVEPPKPAGRGKRPTPTAAPGTPSEQPPAPIGRPKAPAAPAVSVLPPISAPAAPETPAAAPVPRPPGRAGECAEASELAALEPQALLGRLDADTVGCLESRASDAPRMTERRHASALLLADAWGKKDYGRWEERIRYHLDEIDQSDPDLCYKYAAYLVRQGPDRAKAAYRWSGVALENRMVWTGQSYVERVSSLYKIRAASAQSLWQLAEGRAPRSDEADGYRDLAKVAAREWLEYARETGSSDEATALELCRQASGNSLYCD